MPSPQFNTTPEDDGADGNPWDEGDNGHDRPMDAPQSKLCTEIQRTTSAAWRTHTRSHTTAGHPLRSSSPSPADASGRGSSLDLHETRPSLRRIINASRSNSEEEEGSYMGPQPPNTEAEKEAEVIVHQVQSTDSLPGVALKYNVPLATLRTANKLWASDSIHLRQVLYIPTQAVASQSDRCEPMRLQLRPCLSSTSPHSAPDVRTQPSSSRMRRSASDWEAPTDSETTITHVSTMHSTFSGNHATIKRVPLSELSFFPPSSTSALSTTNYPRPRPLPPVSPVRANASRFNTVSSSSRITSPSAFPFFSSGSGNGAPALGLPGFLNGAREEIISRLSFDSTRGSSDTGEEPEVEMDVVRSVATFGRQHSDMDGSKMRSVESEQNGKAEMGVGSSLERDSVVLNTPRRLKSKVVRTVQLQPSPSMEIPGVDRAPNGIRSAGSLYERG